MLTPRLSASAHASPDERATLKLPAETEALAVVAGPRRTLPTSARFTSASESSPVTSVSPEWMTREEMTSLEMPSLPRTDTAPEILLTTGTAAGAGASAATTKLGQSIKKRPNHARYRTAKSGSRWERRMAQFSLDKMVGR